MVVCLSVNLPIYQSIYLPGGGSGQARHMARAVSLQRESGECEGRDDGCRDGCPLGLVGDEEG